MDSNKVSRLLVDSARLARDVQPLIEKQSACRLRATEVADDLVRYGVIGIEKRAEVESQLQDPTYAYDLLSKLASQVPAASLGEVSKTEKLRNASPEDVLERWLLS